LILSSASSRPIEGIETAVSLRSIESLLAVPLHPARLRVLKHHIHKSVIVRLKGSTSPRPIEGIETDVPY